MSVHLTPNNALGFNRPFTLLVKKTISVKNNNTLPVAFKVKTTAPKLYCVRPNSGRIEPGDSVDVSVMLQPMREEPPLTSKCKDKFLIQSTLITDEKETKELQEIWNASGGTGEDWKVHQQKLRVVYLPPEGQTLEEEDEGHPQDGPAAAPADDSKNGAPRTDPAPSMPPVPLMPPWTTVVEGPSTSTMPPPIRITTPPVHDYVGFAESEAHFSLPASNGAGIINVTLHPPPLAAVAPASMSSQDAAHELEKRLMEAQVEIQRLRTLLAAVPDPSSTAPDSVAPESLAAPAGLRQRYASSDDDDSVTQYAPTEAMTMVDHHDAVIHQDGVPLQVVIIIALGVFITTYLFF